jgi:ankyrin repeat protein
MNRIASSLLFVLMAASTQACKAKPSSEALEIFPDQNAAFVADAMKNDDGAKVSQLVKAGANVNAVGAEGRSLLEFAIWKDKPNSAAALINAGADLTHADNRGAQAIHYAAQADDATALDLLIAKKVDINTINAQTGDSPLMVAVLSHTGPQIHTLIKAGANLNIAEPLGDTALFIAAEANASAVLELLNAGADPLAKNKRGDTFQRYLNLQPAKTLSPDAARERAAINQWLEAHKIPVEEG